MLDQTQAEERAQEAREARRNARAWRECDLLAASREKPLDEPGDEAARSCSACGLPLLPSPPEHGMPGAWWCTHCGEY